MDADLRRAILLSLREQKTVSLGDNELRQAIKDSLAPEKIPETLDIRTYVPKNHSATHRSTNSDFILTRYRAIPDGTCLLYSIFTIFYLSDIPRLERFTRVFLNFLKLRNVNLFRTLIANIINSYKSLFTEFVKLLYPQFLVYLW